MALRVLLADESSTIKKVMQLSLQDFDVEVKAVPNGLDVLDVAKAFKPELVFADILLGKKNGYEVCAELKSDSQLHKVPVILMWSGFMEVDESKAKLAKPDDRLEKPFDAEILRALVQKWVPRLSSNQISEFLTFPHLPDFVEAAPKLKSAPASQAPMNLSPAFEDMDEPEDFQSVPLPQTHNNSKPNFETPKAQPSSDDPWSHQDLTKFKISVEEEDLTRDYQMAAQDLSGSSVIQTHGSGLEEISLEDMDLGAPSPFLTKPSKISSDLPSMTQLSHERLEELVREQVRSVLENIAWKILPDVTERIVREEIQKLLKDADQL